MQDLQLPLRIGRLDLAEPDACQWLKQHSHLLANFSADVVVDSEHLTLQSLSEALAPCQALELRISHPALAVFDMSSLVAINSCLVKVEMNGNGPSPDFILFADLRGVTTFSCLTKLTGLTPENYNLTLQEPWPALAEL